MKKQGPTKKENQAEKSRFAFCKFDNCCFWVVFFFSPQSCFVFTHLYFCSQLFGAAVCNTAGEQTTQELHIQSSPPSHQHPKNKTPTETEM